MVGMGVEMGLHVKPEEFGVPSLGFFQEGGVHGVPAPKPHREGKELCTPQRWLLWILKLNENT